MADHSSKTPSEIMGSDEWKNADLPMRRIIFVREVARYPAFANADAETQAAIRQRFNVDDPSTAPKSAEAVAPKDVLDEDGGSTTIDPKLENQLFGELNIPPLPKDGKDAAAEAAPKSLLSRAITDYPYTIGGGLLGFGAGTSETVMNAGNLLKEAFKDAASGKPTTSGGKWLANYAFMDRDFVGGVPQAAAAYQRGKTKGVIGKELQKMYGPEWSPNKRLSIEGWLKEQELFKELAQKAANSQVAKTISGTMGKIPFGSTLAGVGAGLDTAEAVRRYKPKYDENGQMTEEGDVGGAILSGLSAAGQLGMTLPHPVPRLAGTALTLGVMPADYVYQTMAHNKRRAKKGLAPITRKQSEIEYDPMGNPTN